MTRLRGLPLAVTCAVAITVLSAAGCSSSSHRVEPTHPQTGPASPSTGVSYPYDLMTHCGVRYAYFNGHWWEADSPSQQDPAKGSNPYTGYIAETMTLVSQTTARFDLPRTLTVTFHPLGGRPQQCS